MSEQLDEREKHEDVEVMNAEMLKVLLEKVKKAPISAKVARRARDALGSDPQEGFTSGVGMRFARPDVPACLCPIFIY